MIYALQFDDNRIYVGMTMNLQCRVREHRRGKNKSTKGRKITKVLKIEKCSDSISARAREKYWRSGQGREKLKKYSGVEQSGSSSGS